MTQADVCREALEKIAQARALIGSISDNRDEFYLRIDALAKADDNLADADEVITARLAGIEAHLSAEAAPGMHGDPESHSVVEFGPDTEDEEEDGR